MLSQSQTHLSFSGHETFPLRYPWLSKGVQGVMERPSLFGDEDAIVQLGVGKNMVVSIRHWCEVLRLIESIPSGHRPTDLGRYLLAEQGWDPYLEDIGTLWLIHWLMVSRGDKASTWNLAFTQFGPLTFTSSQLADWLFKCAEEASVRTSLASIKKDVQVFIRTYVPSRGSREAVMEDSFDCPLVELGLIKEVDGAYQFVRGPKPSLPPVIFVFALLDYWQKNTAEQGSISFEHLMHGPSSLGGAFKLTENALVERLEQLPRQTGLNFDETAGLRQVLRQQNRLANPMDVLPGYYARREVK